MLASNGFVTSMEHFSSIFEFFRLETIYFALRRLSIIYLLHCTAVSCGVSEQGDESIRYAAVCPLQLHSNERVSASSSPKCAALLSNCPFFSPCVYSSVHSSSTPMKGCLPPPLQSVLLSNCPFFSPCVYSSVHSSVAVSALELQTNLREDLQTCRR